MSGASINRPEASAEVLSALQDGRIDTVLCAVPDLWGRLRGKRVQARTFVDHVLSEGTNICRSIFIVGIEMEPYSGFALADWDNGFPDFRAVPDLETLRRVPWLDRTALVMCDATDLDTGELISVAPRTILKRQIARAASGGYEIRAGTEAEFYAFAEDTAAAREKGYVGLTPHVPFRSDWDLTLTGRVEQTMNVIRQAMITARVEVESAKGEWGYGQHEINLAYQGALEMADRQTIYKSGLKQIAWAAGWSVTFMAKPKLDDVGSSLHVHTSLWDVGLGTTRMSNGSEEMSTDFRHYLGGLVAYSRELGFLLAPSPNSYRRFVSSSFAPTALVWGRDNRTLAFRVVGTGRTFRVENRLPGADANPYLAIAGTIAAGLAGIDRKTALPAMITGNAYDEEGRVPQMASSMGEAIEVLEASDIAREALGPDVVEYLLGYARQELALHPEASEDGFGWELARYFERS